MFSVEKNKPFHSTLTNLNRCYHFPIKDDKAYLKSFYIKTGIVKMIFLYFSWGGAALHLIFTIKDQTGLDISEDLNAFFTCMSCLLACSFFTYRHRKWSTFFNDVTNTSKFGKPADFDAVTKRGNRVSAINYWFGNICLIGYGVAALAEASHCRQLNEEKGLHEVCGTFVSVWLPIEGDKLWIQIVIFSCQMVTGYFIFPSVSVMIYLPWEASEVLISHINHFKSHFLRTFDEPTIQGRSNRLRFCIQYHIHILRMSNDLNLLVKYTVGHISLISALVFSCIGNQIFKAKPIGAVIYLIIYTVGLFGLCHGGQKIMDETLSISDAVYEAEWYKADASTMKDVRFILARSQSPICLDALPLGSLNYPLFLLIIKTSYSYLTLMMETT